MQIKEVLVRRGLLTQQQLEIALAETNGRRVDQVAVSMGLVAEADMLKALGDELGLPYVELEEYPVDRDLLAEFPTTPIFRNALLPLARSNGHVLVATSDP